jgi:hypothetical protein
MKDDKNYYIKGNKPNCSGYRIQSEINGDNLNNIRCKASRTLRHKKTQYLKDKTDELAKNSKNQNIRDLYRGINDKRCYQPRSNLLKDENDNVLAESRNILNRWKNYFSQSLNVHGVSEGRLIQTYTVELSVPYPSPLRLKLLLKS